MTLRSYGGSATHIIVGGVATVERLQIQCNAAENLGGDDGIATEVGRVRQQLQRLGKELTAGRSTPLVSLHHKRLAKGQNEQVMNIPQARMRHLMLWILVEGVQATHERILVEEVEQLTRMKLDGVDEVDGEV